MGRKVGRPRDTDSAETRRRILQAARLRFARDGYQATTNRMIADDVGITPGAIYHYVASKGELYADVYSDTIEEAYSRFEKAAADHHTLFDQYVAVMECATDLQAIDPSISGFMVTVAEEVVRHPDLLELMGPLRSRHVEFFQGLVAGARERGELAADLDDAALADLLGAVLVGMARIAQRADDTRRLRAAVDVLSRFLDGSLLVGPR